MQGQCRGEIQGETSCLCLLTSNPGGWLCCANTEEVRLNADEVPAIEEIIFCFADFGSCCFVFPSLCM